MYTNDQLCQPSVIVRIFRREAPGFSLANGMNGGFWPLESAHAESINAEPAKESTLPPRGFDCLHDIGGLRILVLDGVWIAAAYSRAG